MKQTQKQLFAKFNALIERNYAVSSVVARIPDRNTRRCTYTTCDERAAQYLAQHARDEGFGTVVQAEPNMSYIITINTVSS